MKVSLAAFPLKPLMFKTECPACGQHIEAPHELVASGLKCPACNTGFVDANPKPVTDDEPSFAPPVAQPLKGQLQWLRCSTAYPELRALITVVNVIGIVIIILSALAQISAAFNSSTTEGVIGAFFITVVTIIIAGLWWKLFIPFASLLIDIADACIDLSRRRKE